MSELLFILKWLGLAAVAVIGGGMILAFGWGLVRGMLQGDEAGAVKVERGDSSPSRDSDPPSRAI